MRHAVQSTPAPSDKAVVTVKRLARTILDAFSSLGMEEHLDVASVDGTPTPQVDFGTRLSMASCQSRPVHMEYTASAPE
jgi:hypothetical protein